MTQPIDGYRPKHDLSLDAAPKPAPQTTKPKDAPEIAPNETVNYAELAKNMSSGASNRDGALSTLGVHVGDGWGWTPSTPGTRPVPSLGPGPQTGVGVSHQPVDPGFDTKAAFTTKGAPAGRGLAHELKTQMENDAKEARMAVQGRRPSIASRWT